MKPYLLNELERAVATPADAEGYLVEAARLARADLQDALTGKEKLQATHQAAALVRVARLLATDHPLDRAQWAEWANPNGEACTAIFGPPDPDVREELARALGVQVEYEELSALRHKVSMLESRLRNPPLPLQEPEEPEPDEPEPLAVDSEPLAAAPMAPEPVEPMETEPVEPEPVVLTAPQVPPERAARRARMRRVQAPMTAPEPDDGVAAAPPPENAMAPVVPDDLPPPADFPPPDMGLTAGGDLPPVDGPGVDSTAPETAPPLDDLPPPDDGLDALYGPAPDPTPEPEPEPDPMPGSGRQMTVAERQQMLIQNELTRIRAAVGPNDWPPVARQLLRNTFKLSVRDELPVEDLALLIAGLPRTEGPEVHARFHEALVRACTPRAPERAPAPEPAPEPEPVPVEATPVGDGTTRDGAFRKRALAELARIGEALGFAPSTVPGSPWVDTARRVLRRELGVMVPANTKPLDFAAALADVRDDLGVGAAERFYAALASEVGQAPPRPGVQELLADNGAGEVKQQADRAGLLARAREYIRHRGVRYQPNVADLQQALSVSYRVAHSVLDELATEQVVSRPGRLPGGGPGHGADPAGWLPLK